jgi:hypothetical protein
MGTDYKSVPAGLFYGKQKALKELYMKILQIRAEQASSDRILFLSCP